MKFPKNENYHLLVAKECSHEVPQKMKLTL